MTPQEVKKAIQNGKEVFFDDVSYPWFSMIKDRPDTATYKVVKAKGLGTYHLEFFKFTRHTKDGVKFDITEFAKKSRAKLKLSPIRAIVKNSIGEVLIGGGENYYITKEVSK